MNNKQLAELLKYSDNKSMLIVTYSGKLEKIRCPFKVRVITDVGNLEKGDIEFVESIRLTIKIITVYIINNSAYYYFHFDIIAE